MVQLINTSKSTKRRSRDSVLTKWRHLATTDRKPRRRVRPPRVRCRCIGWCAGCAETSRAYLLGGTVDAERRSFLFFCASPTALAAAGSFFACTRRQICEKMTGRLPACVIDIGTGWVAALSDPHRSPNHFSAWCQILSSRIQAKTKWGLIVSHWLITTRPSWRARSEACL